MKLLPAHDLNLRAALPTPPCAPVPQFYGRRFLSARELLQTGLVKNHVTLRRLIAEKRFPPPLLVGRKLRVWDCLELQALIDRLAAERDGKKTPAVGAAGEASCADAGTDGRQTVEHGAAAGADRST